ncbi:MAG TPA: nitroreductase/quinone reductase family protein [Acidimicrobiia bacterium]|nr:nitroreductase/quinone reductase family protein [Acidimicrobiia bacterium]
MPAVTKSPALRAFWRLHRFLLRISNGRFFTRLGPGRQLLLITRGRKSGESRQVGLTYLTDADRWVVIASNAGEDSHPAWWLNLLAEPRAVVAFGGQIIPVVAHELEEPERSSLLSRFVSEIDAGYADYQRRTTRRIPVVALTRTELAREAGSIEAGP